MVASSRKPARGGRGQALAAAALTCLVAVTVSQSLAQIADADDDGQLYAPSVWDLVLGEHAVDLETEPYREFACGTNGGPPSLPIADWTEFDLCPAEPDTGLHEVYFEYDNELEFWARANFLATQVALYQYTSVYSIPVIASALFDADGFIVGIRLVSDPRVPEELRELGITLGGFLRARFGVSDWECSDLPRLEDESPYLGQYEKQVCEQRELDPPTRLVLETHHYRKPGQRTFDPAGRLTVGYFRSETIFEMFLDEDIADADARLAEIAARPVIPTERELLVRRALDCPGCDLAGVDLKRANLAGANLAGADLSDANLHEANLRGADLSGAILRNANLNGADVRLADVAGADLTDAMMFRAAFDGSDLTGAELDAVRAAEVTMARAILVDATAIVGDFFDSRMNDADFTGADFRGARFNNAQLTRSNFTNAALNQALMQRVNLRNAILRDAEVKSVDLLRADLGGADLTGADFSLSRLTFAILSGTEIEGTVWEGATLPGGFDPN